MRRVKSCNGRILIGVLGLMNDSNSNSARTVYISSVKDGNRVFIDKEGKTPIRCKSHYLVGAVRYDRSQDVIYCPVCRKFGDVFLLNSKLELVKKKRSFVFK